jgi:hypothetical protein
MPTGAARITEPSLAMLSPLRPLELGALDAHAPQHVAELADLAAGARPAVGRAHAAVEQVLGAPLQQAQRPQAPPQQREQPQRQRRDDQAGPAQRLGARGGEGRGQFGLGPGAPHHPVGPGHAGGAGDLAGLRQRHARGFRRAVLGGPGLEGLPQARFVGERAHDPAPVGMREHAAVERGDDQQRVVVAGLRVDQAVEQVAAGQPQHAAEHRVDARGVARRLGEHHDRLARQRAVQRLRDDRPALGQGAAEVVALGQRQRRARDAVLGIDQDAHFAVGPRDVQHGEEPAQDRLAVHEARQRRGVVERGLVERFGDRQQRPLQLDHAAREQGGGAGRLAEFAALLRGEQVAFGDAQQHAGAQRDAQRQRHDAAQREADLERSEHALEAPAWPADHQIIRAVGRCARAFRGTSRHRPGAVPPRPW